MAPKDADPRRPDAKDSLLERLVCNLAERLPFSHPSHLNDTQIRKLINRLAEPYQISDAVERIELDEQIKALGERAVPALLAFLAQWGPKRKDLLRKALSLLKPHRTSEIAPALS